jgi:hypothetical protein
MSSPVLPLCDLENPGAVAAEAERIGKNVQFTRYQHDEDVSEETGRYLMDCSEFVSYVLGRVAPQHLALISREIPQYSPLAFEYYDYFSYLKADSNGWQRIGEVADLQRGDILAWRLLDHPEKGKDTGHVLIC